MVCKVDGLRNFPTLKTIPLLESYREVLKAFYTNIWSVLGSKLHSIESATLLDKDVHSIELLGSASFICSGRVSARVMPLMYVSGKKAIL